MIARLRSPIIALAGLATPALAGLPFLTDDPEPTDTGDWEIYAPSADFAERGVVLDGSAGAEIHYGEAPNLQLPSARGLLMRMIAATGGWERRSGVSRQLSSFAMRRQASRSPSFPA